MENIKSKIIPESLKSNIDEVMERQLFNANRYYAESNPEISSLMEKELHQSPMEFLHRLKTRWNWHNTYYELLLEPAFDKIIRENFTELSPAELDDIINIYSTSCLVDEATLVMSGSIKKYLDYNCKNIGVIDENISAENLNIMLITPPIETFFAQYQIDHLYYIYLLKTNDTDTQKFKNYLLKKYHANDEKIFASRFQKKFKNNLSMTERELLEDIKHYKIPEYYKTQHFYFTIEHPDRKAIRDIIIYDNLDEKLIASNLIGISGFLFRRKILEYLNNSGILKNDGYIYEFNNDIIINSLERLKEERENNMDKDVRPYKQRGDTCAIVCMMMVLEYYKVIPKANWYDERRLYKLYGSKYMDGAPFSALAYYMSKKGLETTICHESQELFKNDQGVINRDDFKFAMDEYKEYLKYAENNGTKIVNGMDITIDVLKQKLQNGDLVILAGEVPGAYHAILLTGYDQDGFKVCDPLYNTKQSRTFDEIEKFMNTSIGKWLISVNDKTKEKENLINNLEKFNDEAQMLMTKQENRSLKHVKK